MIESTDVSERDKMTPQQPQHNGTIISKLVPVSNTVHLFNEVRGMTVVSVCVCASVFHDFINWSMVYV